MALAVADRSSNKPEQIVHAAEEIGKSAHRAALFRAIYAGKRRVKTVSELMKKTRLSYKQVLNAGKRLVHAEIVTQTKVDGETAYQKITFLQPHRDRILKLAQDRKARESVPTKRGPRPSAAKSVRVKVDLRLPKARVLAKHITIDDIESFSSARRVSAPGSYIAMKEQVFKKGLASVLGEKGRFKDWGGELSDLFSTRLRIGGKRRVAALALKGPGKTGVLTPGKMGKNGDQIQRLVRCPAAVFIVQYWAEIDQSVLEQLEKLVQLKSYLEGRALWYGLVDGDDSARIILGYRKHFPLGEK